MTNVHDTIKPGQEIEVNKLEAAQLVSYGAAEYVVAESEAKVDESPDTGLVQGNGSQEIVPPLDKLKDAIISGEVKLEGGDLVAVVDKEKEELEVGKPDAIASDPSKEDAKEKEQKAKVQTKEEKAIRHTK